MTDLGKLPGAEGRPDRQHGWQTIAGSLLQGVSILDVGAGLGMSRSRLAVNGNTVRLQDIAPGLPVDLRCPVASIPHNSYDAVTAFDVIEHVEYDVKFLVDLVRIARRYVVLSTPNGSLYREVPEYHARHYTPIGLLDLVCQWSVCLMMSGKDYVHEVHSLRSFKEHMDPAQFVMIRVDD